jgi:hypothetical protein
MSHVNQIAASQKQNIFCIKGKTEAGFDCYHYVLIKPEMIPFFERIANGGNMKISDYGTVLKKGYGEPTEEVKKFMFEKYGFK